jgi:hypothetical protein
MTPGTYVVVVQPSLPGVGNVEPANPEAASNSTRNAARPNRALYEVHELQPPWFGPPMMPTTSQLLPVL